MDKRFKLHIKWSNLTKTEGIAELSDNGQPLLKTECIEDARLLQTILNELHEENQELKQLIKKMGELGGFNKHMIKTICEGLDD